jgi:4-carboxymuconolactone decarboxylase
MRRFVSLSNTRIEPLPESEWTDEVRELMDRLRRDGQVYNIFATLARYPQLFKSWLGFAGHILGKSTLSPRDREIAILRIGWLCRCRYEWGHHVAIGKEIGLSADEIRRISVGADAPGWSPFEATLIRAVDELEADARLSNGTWAALAELYSTEQLLDLVFTVGQYRLVSIVLNSVGIQLEPGFEGLPDEA